MRRWWVAVAGVLAVAWGLAQRGRFYNLPDTEWYLHMARGEMELVAQPFSARQLGPMVVRGLHHALGWTVERGFLVQGLVCLVLLALMVFWRAGRTRTPDWMLVAMVAIPFWPTLLSGLVLPDLWYAMLLAATLVLVEREWWGATALMMFPLMVSRESTMMTVVCLLVAGWRRMPRRWMAVAVAASVAGMVVVKHLSTGGMSNREHLPPVVYLMAKAPWNLLRNVLGVVPWSNVYPVLCPVTGPRWQVALHLGPVHALGICQWSPVEPIQMLWRMSAAFGLLPLVLLFVWWRSGWKLGETVLLRFAMIYGLLGVVLTPMLGMSTERLFGYAWPLFLVALPLWMDKMTLPARPEWGWRVLALHVVAGLAVIVMPEQTVLGIVVEIVLYGAGWMALRRWWGTA